MAAVFLVTYSRVWSNDAKASREIFDESGEDSLRVLAKNAEQAVIKVRKKEIRKSNWFAIEDEDGVDTGKRAHCVDIVVHSVAYSAAADWI